MAGKTKAQIEFKVETSEFSAGIKKMNTDIKSLNSQLKLNATQLKGNADDVGLLQERQKLLQTELAASQDKVDLTVQSLAKCKDILGENSTEYQALSNAVNAAKSQQATIENELSKTTKAISDQEAKMSAYNQTMQATDTKMSSLDKELKLNATEMESAADKTQLLAERNDLLSQKLEESKTKVKATETALDQCKTSLGENSDEYRELSDALNDAKSQQAAIENELNATTQAIADQEAKMSAYNRTVTEADTKMASLDKELKLNATEMQGAGDKTKLLAERNELLAQKLEESKTKVKATETALDQCKDSLGENSDEYRELSDALIDAKEEQAAIQNEIKTTTKELDAQSDKLTKTADKLEQFGSKTESAGRKMSALSVVIGAAFVGAATSAISFDDAFTGVLKTVDGTPEQLESIRQGIMDMSEETASSAVEIAAVAEAAGQLGISTEDILNFTKTMVMMGDSTNLGATDAATALARFANITGTTADEYIKLGSVVVDLGNKFETSEAEIVDMAQNLAASGDLAGLTEPQIMALATALSSVGIEADAGGTAMSKLLKKIQVAVETGSNDLNQFASVAGMTSAEFKTAFEQDAVGALSAFIGGLNDTERNGKSAIVVLAEMGLTEARLSNAILSLANSEDVMTDAINTANTAWGEGTALAVEAERRYANVASQLKQLKAKIINAGIAFGDILLPKINAVADKIGSLMEWFQGLNDSQRTTIMVIAGVVAAIGPALIIIGKISTGISVLMKGYAAFKTALAATKVAQVGLTAAMAANPIGLIVAAVVALIAIFVILWTKCEGFRNFWITIWEQIKSTMAPIINEIKESFSGLGKKFAGLKDLFIVIGTSIATQLVPVLAILSGAFHGLLATVAPIIDAIGGVIDILSGLGSLIVAVFTGDMEKAKESVGKITGGIKDLFGGLWGAVSGFLSGFLTGVKSFFAGLLKAVGFDTSGFGKKISEYKDRLLSIWQNIKTAMTPTIDFIKDKIETLGAKFTEFKEQVIIVWDRIKTAISPAIDDIKESFRALEDKLTEQKQKFIDTWDKINYYITPTVNKIKETFSDLGDKFSELKQKFEDTWNKIQPKIDSMKESFGKLKESMGELAKEFKEKWTEIKQDLSPVIDKIKELFGDVEGNISLLELAFKAIKAVIIITVVPAFTMLIGIISGVLSAIAPIITAIGGVIDIISGFASLVISFFTGDLAGARESVRQIIDGIIALFGGMTQAVFGFLSGFVTGVIEFFRGLWEMLVGHSIVPDTINGIVEWFAQLPERVLGILLSFGTSVVAKFEEIKTAVIEKVTAIYNGIRDKFEAAKSAAGEKIESMKSAVISKFEAIRSGIAAKVEAIRSAIVDKFTAAKTTALSVFDAIRTGIENKITAAKDAVTRVISKIKEAMNFSWSIPKPKMPKVSVSVAYKTIAGIKIPYPDFNISWQAKGGIFSKPTILGYNPAAGSMIGVGEAGPEAVTPLSTLEDFINNAFQRNVAAPNATATESKIGSLISAIEDIANRPIVLAINGKEFATATAADTDTVSGQRISLKERGLAL